jgi:hypothetical protein
MKEKRPRSLMSYWAPSLNRAKAAVALKQFVVTVEDTGGMLKICKLSKLFIWSICGYFLWYTQRVLQASWMKQGFKTRLGRQQTPHGFEKYVALLFLVFIIYIHVEHGFGMIEPYTMYSFQFRKQILFPFKYGGIQGILHILLKRRSLH